MPRVVLDLEQHVGGRVQRGQHLGQRGSERRVQDHGARPGVVEEVAQFLADVAVVHVEGGDPGAVGAEHALEVLVAVVEGEREMVLARLPARQLAPLAVHAQALAVQVVRQPLGPLGHVAVAEAAVAPDDAFAVGQALDQDVEGLGQVELDGGLWG